MYGNVVRRKLFVVVVLALVAGLVQAVWAPPAIAEVVPKCGPSNDPVAQGSGHAMFLDADGTVWATGTNYDGVLGDGTTTDRLSPVQVVGLSDVVAVETSWYSSFAITSDGSLWAWGDNYYGQLGDGTTLDSYSPQKVEGLPEILQVEASLDFTVALADDGTVGRGGVTRTASSEPATRMPALCRFKCPGSLE